MSGRSVSVFLSWLNRAPRPIRINRWDWAIFTLYWLVAIPITYYFNIEEHGFLTTLQVILFAFVLNSLAVWMMLYVLFYMLARQQYILAPIALLFLLILLSLCYMTGYGLIYYNSLFSLSFDNIMYGMQEHLKSYGILFVVATGKKIFDTVLQLERSERLKAENELKLLRSQIQPHFLFNTLNDLYSIIHDTNPRATALLQKLSSLLRYTLYKSGNQQVALKDELRFLQDYFSLQKMHYNDPAKLDFTIHGNPGDLKVAPGILITFVENAFKHGLRTTQENASVKFFIGIQDQVLHFEARNTKNGTAAKHAPGIGIKNARDQLRLQYKNRHRLDVSDESSSFFVNLKIQLNG